MHWIIIQVKIGAGSGKVNQTNYEVEEYRRNEIANVAHVWPGSGSPELFDADGNKKDISYGDPPGSWNYLWAPSRVRTSDFLKNITLPDYMSAMDNDHAHTLIAASGSDGGPNGDQKGPSSGSASGSGSPFSRYPYSRYQFNISGLAGPGLPDFNFATFAPTFQPINASMLSGASTTP